MNNIFIAYALWFFIGYLGAHRLYLGRFISGFAQMALFFVGSVTLWIFIGWIFWAAWGIWWLADLFLTGKIVDENTIKQNLKNDLKNKDIANSLRTLYEMFERGEISKTELEARKEILFR